MMGPRPKVLAHVTQASCKMTSVGGEPGYLMTLLQKECNSSVIQPSSRWFGRLA